MEKLRVRAGKEVVFAILLQTFNAFWTFTAVLTSTRGPRSDRIALDDV